MLLVAFGAIKFSVLATVEGLAVAAEFHLVLVALFHSVWWFLW
jgi:hypothetical protein